MSVSDGPGPRTRDFTNLRVMTVVGGTISRTHMYKDAFVTFWPDGWAEVYGTSLNEQGTELGQITTEYSIHQTVFMDGKEREDDIPGSSASKVQERAERG